MPITPYYEILESTSEHKLKIVADNLIDLFRHALFAMFETMAPVYQEHAALQIFPVDMSSADHEQLLIDFLSEALAIADAKKLAFVRVDIHELKPTSLKAHLVGRAIVRNTLEIKAVTYHDVHITTANNTLCVTIIFDI